MADAEVCSQALASMTRAAAHPADWRPLCPCEALRYAPFEEVLDPKAFVQSSWLFGPPRGETR